MSQTFVTSDVVTRVKMTAAAAGIVPRPVATHVKELMKSTHSRFALPEAYIPKAMTAEQAAREAYADVSDPTLLAPDTPKSEPAPKPAPRPKLTFKKGPTVIMPISVTPKNVKTVLDRLAPGDYEQALKRLEKSNEFMASLEDDVDVDTETPFYRLLAEIASTVSTLKSYSRPGRKFDILDQMPFIHKQADKIKALQKELNGKTEEEFLANMYNTIETSGRLKALQKFFDNLPKEKQKELTTGVRNANRFFLAKYIPLFDKTPDEIMSPYIPKD